MVTRIAKDGIDAASGSVIDMSMTSEANSLKVFDEGEWSVNITDLVDPTTKVIPHNLGYAPCFRVTGQNDVSSAYFLYPNASGAVSAFVYSDAANLYIKLYPGFLGGPATISGYYYIFQDNI
jgi:hypothetical protein